MRANHLFFLLLLLVASFAAVPAWGQYPPELAAGRRVRIQSPTPGSGRITARVVSIHPEWFTVQTVGDSVVWEQRLAALDTLIVSQGHKRKRSALWGVAWGTYVGASATAIAGVLAANSLNRDVGESIALGAAAGTLVGAPLGAAIGAIFAPERWQVYLVPRARE